MFVWDYIVFVCGLGVLGRGMVFVGFERREFGGGGEGGISGDEG